MSGITSSSSSSDFPDVSYPQHSVRLASSDKNSLADQYSSSNISRTTSPMLYSSLSYDPPTLCHRCHQWSCTCLLNSLLDTALPDCSQVTSSVIGDYRGGQHDPFGSSWSRTDASIATGMQPVPEGQAGMNQHIYSSESEHMGSYPEYSAHSSSIPSASRDSWYHEHGNEHLDAENGSNSDSMAGGGCNNTLFEQSDGSQSAGFDKDESDGAIQCKLKCRSKRGFKNRQAYEAHLRNVHCKKLETWKCRVEHCSRLSPFNSKTDLDRHTRSMHNLDKPYQCQRPGCPARAKEFPRKDKLKAHDKKYHSNFRCFFCSQDSRLQRWFEYEWELWAHTLEEHSESCHTNGTDFSYR